MNKFNVFYILIAFILGLIMNRALNIINRTDLVDYFNDYGIRVVKTNEILDRMDRIDNQIRIQINTELLRDLYCSPMFYYLPKALDRDTDVFNNFWEGYLLAFEYSKLDESEINANEFNCIIE